MRLLTSAQLRRRQRGVEGVRSARAGSMLLVLSVGLSGALTYAFQFLSQRALGPEGYGALFTLWSATFLAAQVLWTGATQTLGRHVAERDAREEDWGPVELGVRHLQWLLLGGFLLAALAASVPLTRLFGDWRLTAAWVVAVSGYAWSYYRRGLLSGHRQFGRLAGVFVLEAASRLLLAAALLGAGVGMIGPAVGIALAPLLTAWLIRPAPVGRHARGGAPFNTLGALAFAGPVLLCMSCAQALANGGPLLIAALGGAGAREQAGLLGAGLILTRAPQYVLSPAISNLLPHLSRLVAVGDRQGFDRFALRACALIALAGVGLVAGAALFGPWAMGLGGPGFRLGRGLLSVLALVAALYLLAEVLNQVLFARGLARLAAAGWLLGLVVTGLAAWLIRAPLLERISYALALGTLAAVLALSASHLLTRHRSLLSSTAGEPSI